MVYASARDPEKIVVHCETFSRILLYTAIMLLTINHVGSKEKEHNCSIDGNITAWKIRGGTQASIGTPIPMPRRRGRLVRRDRRGTSHLHCDAWGRWWWLL